MLSYDVEGSRFLDLFSGSGAIGIEALSRGAEEAVFVENNRRAAACIRENLAHTHLAERAVLMEENVMYALKRLDREGRAFSFIFMDPPYGKLLEKEVLLFLEKSSLCDAETRIIVEADLETDFFLSGQDGISHDQTEKIQDESAHFHRKIVLYIIIRER